MLHLQHNPAWTDEAVKASWPSILSFTSKHSLPLPVTELTARLKPHWNEYGCGHYGCVFPTTNANVVMKVAADPNEIDFTLRQGQLRNVWVDGLTRYYGLLPIKGKRRKEDIVAIWRESADHTGKLQDYAKKSPELMEFGKHLMQTVHHGWRVNISIREDYKYSRKFLQLVEDAMPVADKATRAAAHRIADTTKSPVEPEITSDGAEGLALYVAMNVCAYAVAAGAMMAKPVSHYVGKSMVSLLSHRVVVGDVHWDNVGIVTRDGKPTWVITDPGAQTVVDVNYKPMPVKPWALPTSGKLEANAASTKFLPAKLAIDYATGAV